MAGDSLKVGSLITIAAILYALYIRESVDTRLGPVKNSLLALELDAKVTGPPRVALGYGACHDLFVNATALFSETGTLDAPAHFNEISNKEELLRSFAYYFKHGAAAE